MTVPIAATHFAAAAAVHPIAGIADTAKMDTPAKRRLAHRLVATARRPIKAVHATALGLLHWRALEPLRSAARDSNLSRLLKAYPDVWGIALTPMMTSAWDARARIARLTDHCQLAERLGTPFNLKPFHYVDLLRLDGIDARYRVTLDQPGWLLRDGLLTISLWDGIERMFTLSFCFARQGGELVAYVGGVQGKRDPEVLEKYREITKAAHGMRPRDLLIELFRLLCQSVSVDRILCVSDDIRYQKSRYFLLYGTEPHIDANYDQAWEERAAIRRSDGFFELPLQRVDRAADGIPARKRAMYRQRYAMLDQISHDLSAAISGKRLQVKAHNAAAMACAA